MSWELLIPQELFELEALARCVQGINFPENDIQREADIESIVTLIDTDLCTAGLNVDNK